MTAESGNQELVNYSAVEKNDVELGHRNVNKNTLHFDVSFTVEKSGKKRQIISNVSDVIQSGSMLAIMGPSGAGKTTLLRVLTMEAMGGVSEGTVTLNGVPMTSAVFKHACGIVAQEDHHWAFLTCRETIEYAAEMLLPNMNAQEKEKEVNNMISKMGLDSCANTVVGNAFKHGLSGGQKRRLSLAVVLMKKLQVVFMDEPTSGLDAAAAAGIMEFVRMVTKKENLITAFTVHQPSTQIYNSFDRIMLLSKGRIAYCGVREDVAFHLTSVGHALPPQTNPAEFLLDIVNTDFTDDEQVEKILTGWTELGNEKHQQRIQDILGSSSKANGVDFSEPVGVNGMLQAWILLKRHTLLASRDPMIYMGRAVLFLVVSIFFAIIYIEARERTQDQVLSRMWFMTWINGVPSNMGVVAVYVFNTEFFTIKKEVKNGMVSPLPYIVSNAILQIPVMFIFALATLSVGGYGMIDFTGSHFGQMLLIYALVFYGFESIAQCLAVAIPNPLLGMLQFVNLWFSSFLFCGLFLKIEDITWPFRIFSYIMPYRYAFRAMAYQEYIDATFKGAQLCDPDTDSSCLSGGYKCDDSSTVCYGRNGGQVLESLRSNFPVYENRDTFGSDVGVLVAIAVVAKLMFVIFMTINSKAESKISATK